MRFRVKDLLLLTALLAIYLTALMYVLQSKEWEMPGKSEMIIFVTIFPCTSAGLNFFLYHWNLRRVSPLACNLHASIQWVYLFYNLVFVVAFAGIARFFEDVLGISMFLGASMPFLLILLRSFFSGHVPVGRRGIIYLSYLVPWNKVFVVYDSEGVIQKLQTSKYWWSPVIPVPPELRVQIQQLIQQDNIEAIP